MHGLPPNAVLVLAEVGCRYIVDAAPSAVVRILAETHGSGRSYGAGSTTLQRLIELAKDVGEPSHCEARMGAQTSPGETFSAAGRPITNRGRMPNLQATIGPTHVHRNHRFVPQDCSA